MASINATRLVSLLGSRVEFVQRLFFDYGPDFERYHARVMAIQLPAPGTGVEFAVLLLRDGSPPDHMDYVDLDCLYFPK